MRGRGHWIGQRRGEAVTTETLRPQTQPQAEVVKGKPAGMLVAVVRDASGDTWVWAYERNQTPYSPPNRGILGGEVEEADVAEAARHNTQREESQIGLIPYVSGAKVL